jgi:hypothetical protein
MGIKRKDLDMATVAQLRVLVQDSEGTSQILEDEDYESIIAIEENTYRAAALAARTLAAKYAQKVDVSAGPVAVKNTQKYEHYADLAKDYDQRAREGGGEGGGGVGAGAGAPQLTGTSIDEMDSQNEDEDRYSGNFQRGMNDNPPAPEADDDYCEVL